MTCREKLMQEHPEINYVQLDVLTRIYCPFEMGIDYPPEQVCRRSSCRTCWDTEIPEIENIKKENYIMPTHDMSVNTKRTKAELLEEIKLAHEHIQEMENRINNMERYKQYEDMADEMKAMHTAFINSGFTREEAFDMLKLLVGSAVPAALRGVGL